MNFAWIILKVTCYLTDNNVRLCCKDQEANVFGKMVAACSENCKERIIRIGEMSRVRILEILCTCR